MEDADSQALHSDVREDDADKLGFEQWFKPLASGDVVPPYARS